MSWDTRVFLYLNWTIPKFSREDPIWYNKVTCRLTHMYGMTFNISVRTIKTHVNHIKSNIVSQTIIYIKCKLHFEFGLNRNIFLSLLSRHSYTFYTHLLHTLLFFVVMKKYCIIYIYSFRYTFFLDWMSAKKCIVDIIYIIFYLKKKIVILVLVYHVPPKMHLILFVIFFRFGVCAAGKQIVIYNVFDI